MNQRLQELSNNLRSVPQHKFNYRRWFTYQVAASLPEELRDHNCGTTGCALGYCVLFWPDDWAIYGNEPGLIDAHGDPYQAAVEFFDIRLKDAVELFCPNAVEGEFTAIDVADKIQQFIERDNHERETPRTC